MTRGRHRDMTPDTHHRHPTLRHLAVLALGLAAACSTGQPRTDPTAQPSEPESTLSITVNGHALEIPIGSDIATALTAANIHVARGRLLDVNGNLLDRHGVRPTLTLGGAAAQPDAPLTAGAILVARDGRERKEAVATTRIKSDLPNDPQYLLGGERGVYTVREGAVSGIAVSTTFTKGKGHSHPKSVALTFDDGPDPVETPQILNILDREHVPATFFVVGAKAEAEPGLIQQIIDEGHTIGTHSWSHPTQPPMADLSTEELQMQITRPIGVLEALGYTPHLFRPPGGSFDARVIAIAREAQMRTVMWSVGTGDFMDEVPPHHIMNAVLRRLRPGAIILLHDGAHANTDQADEHSATVKVLPDLIKAIEHRGYAIVPLEPYVESGAASHG